MTYETAKGTKLDLLNHARNDDDAASRDDALAWLTKLSPLGVWSITIASLLTAALCDWYAGTDIVTGPLYLIPVIIAAWAINERAGLALGTISAIVSIHLNGLTIASPEQVTPLVNLINIAMRLFAVALVVIIVGACRRSFERERARARIDSLTGVLNERGFAEWMDGRHRACQSSYAFVTYMDLDGFKAVNDAHGHFVGDIVLRTFAQAARALIRRDDCFARLGGDEFALLVTGDSPQECETITALITDELNTVLDALPYAVSCSSGGVLIRTDTTIAWRDHLRAADHLMYARKQAERNGSPAPRVIA